MGESNSNDVDVGRALELADGYLSEAETVLWTAAAEAESADKIEAIEALTQEVWQVQHQLATLQSQDDG
jgi:hypothetical protein